MFEQSLSTEYRSATASVRNLLKKSKIATVGCNGIVNARIYKAAAMAIFWARVSCSLALKDARFKMRITLGVVLIRSLVCTVCVPGCLRGGSGVALN